MKDKEGAESALGAGPDAYAVATGLAGASRAEAFLRDQRKLIGVQHLKCGHALVHAGKRDEARAHFARAATHDLTPSQKSELARMRAHV